MKDKEDNIIYVGKAISLKNRVRSYFRKTNKTARIQKMVSLIDHFEYIVTNNELEAFILELNLIKKYDPRYNILLKDDKSYPYKEYTNSQIELDRYSYNYMMESLSLLRKGLKY